MRRFSLMLDQEPQSKKIKLADALAFRRALLDRLQAAGRMAFRSDVVLQLDFFTSAKNPPAIYNLPKNYIDLMWKRAKVPDDARPQLLLRDDRQVKALIVRYHLGGASSWPGVWVQAEPFRDFLADLDLTERIQRNDFEDDRDQWRSSGSDDLKRGPFHCQESWDEHGFRQLAEFERDRKRVTEQLGNDAYECQRQMMRMSAQQEHLRGTDRLICLGLLHAFQSYAKPEGDPHNDILNRIALRTRNMMLGEPFVLDFHYVPRREGDSAVFKQILRTALNDFKAKHPDLFPLSTLLNVTMLMIQPEGCEKKGGMDLDNLATTILRALHDIWVPPSSFAHAFKTDNIESDDLREYWDQARNKLPKAMTTSVTEYRVFQLPRLPDDPKDGFIRMAVGDGMNPIRLREEVDEYLEKWEEAINH
ncbi:MAG TPA: hypothetical protein VH643_02680 [Gemmataceae bacterium]